MYKRLFLTTDLSGSVLDINLSQGRPPRASTHCTKSSSACEMSGIAIRDVAIIKQGRIGESSSFHAQAKSDRMSGIDLPLFFSQAGTKR